MAFLVAYVRSKWISLTRSQPTSPDPPEDIQTRKERAEGWKAFGRSQPTSVRARAIEAARVRKVKAEKEAQLKKENDEKEAQVWTEWVAESKVDIDYQRIKNLAFGEFGTVHLAVDRSTGRYCTIKEKFKCRMLQNPEIYGTLREIKIMIQVSDSPFFIKFWESFENTEKVFIVMENAGGGSLRYFLRNHQFEDFFLPFYAAEILIGLQYLHNHNIIHRNLSPDTLFMTTDGHMKIGGFGWSEQYVCDEQRVLDKVGSPFYMAPERFEERGYTKHSDYWSYGIVLIEILGRPNPFFGKNPQQQSWDQTKAKVFDQNLMFRLKKDYLMNKSHGLIYALLQEESTRIKPTVIRQHPLFQRTNWEAMEKHTIWPPMQGIVTNYRDLSAQWSDYSCSTTSYFCENRPTPVRGGMELWKTRRYK